MAEQKGNSQSQDSQKQASDVKPECFVVMPISDPDGYEPGHFQHVYNDIIAPACATTGFKPIRSDDVKQTNLIHLDILQKLLDSSMCLCDLSTLNPNVMFELALRQAFDKPVLLVQEIGTNPIFDISPLRYAEYRKERIYHEVLEDQQAIATALKETYEQGRGINSIVRLLSLGQPATLVEPENIDRQSDMQSLILAEVEQMRAEFRSTMRKLEEGRREATISANLDKLEEAQRSINQLEEMVQQAEIFDEPLPDIEYVKDGIARLRLLLDKHMSRSSRERDTERLKELIFRLDELDYRFRKTLEKQATRTNKSQRKFS
ncbi:MAG: hypothetical protein ACOC6S_00240 [Chloroflexota bacterium]